MSSPDELANLLRSVRCHRRVMTHWFEKPRLPALRFQVTKWSLEIWDEGAQNAREFPQVVYLRYQTRPQPKSGETEAKPVPGAA